MRSRVCGVVVLLAVLAAGCSGGDEADAPSGTPDSSEGARPSDPESSSTDSSSEPDPDPPPTAEPTEAAPATGVELVVDTQDVDLMSYRLPEGTWELTASGRTGTTSAETDPSYVIALTNPTFGTR